MNVCILYKESTQKKFCINDLESEHIPECITATKVFIGQPLYVLGDSIQPYKEDLIKVLVESKALEFGKFTLKSGRISPYFINMGRALNTGEYAARTCKAYVEEIFSQLPDFDYIHGPAYKGIPLAALVSAYMYTTHAVNKRWGYDRKEEKTYGDLTEKAIVGTLRNNDKVLIIDDVVTTGKTKIENWEKLTTIRNGLTPVGILIAVDRQEKEKSGISVSQALKEEGFTLFSILKITEVFEYLSENLIQGKKYVDEEIKASFENYFAEYGAY